MNDPNPQKLIKFVFFDLETNGCAGTGSILNPFHRIVQISAVSGDERFDAIVNPEVHIPSDSTAIHHVTNEMAQTAPLFKEIFPKFRAFVKKGAKRNTQIVLVAHNALGFDKPVLEKEVLRCGLKSPENWRYYDTLLTYRREFAELPSKRLGDIHQTRFNESIQNAHNALSDTLALQRLFSHDIQSLFDMNHTVMTGASSYTPNEAPVQNLRGVGPYTKRAIALMLAKNNPTVGDLRAYCSGKSEQDVELFLRLKLHCKKEAFLFSLLCELTLCNDPNALFERFPYSVHAFPGLSDKTINHLLGMRIRSPEELNRHYLYGLKESAEAWDVLLSGLECEVFRVAMLMRNL